MPIKAKFLALMEGRLILSLNEDWKRTAAPTLPQGSLVSLELSAISSDPRHLRPELVYAPSAREAFQEAGAARGYLLVQTLDNVNGRAYSYKPEPHHHWSR